MIPKFRAKYHNKIWGVYGINWERENISLCYPPQNPALLYTSIDWKDIDALIRPTGLFDKNGKEIFEGDIIAHSDYYSGDCYEKAGIGVVAWDDGAFVLFNPHAKDENHNFIEELNSTTISNLNIKVVGNIYENPELMKENAGSQKEQI